MATNQFVGPRAKLRAVRREGNVFRAELSRYIAENKAAVKMVMEPPRTDRVIVADFVLFPEDLCVMVGTIAYQLRSSLDLLACALARWSGQTDVSDVSFPIAKTREHYLSTRTQNKIRKLAPELRAMINAYEPFGGHILVGLNELANMDDHRDIIDVIPSIKDTGWTIHGRGDFDLVEAWFRKPLPTERGQIELLRIPATTPFDWVHLKVQCHIIFAVEPLVGKPVSQTLTEMERTVEGIIKQFETHCFGV